MAFFLIKYAHIFPAKEKPQILGLLLLFPIIFSQIYELNFPLLIISIAFILLGFIDDLLKLRPLVKLIGEIFLTVLFAILFKFYLIIPLFLLLFVVNGYNLTDGINGLLSIFSFISFLGIFIIFHDLNIIFFLSTLLIIIYLNFPKGKYYMGDSGSLFLGFYTFYLISNNNSGTLPIVFYLIIFSYYPLIDTSYAFLRRMLKKKNPFKGDRDHIHHRLQRRFGNINTNLLIEAFLIANIVIFVTLFQKYNLTNLEISIIMIILEFLGLIYAGQNTRVQNNR
ncbi:undecaprenyl/decaprenyl-phosphate alpha-N-acetylglucosaminyl 1-phosphate transferase [bacterium]|nr:undecaprenyl/decaprenyl-phosphate alpha-N-acetylglucosaminyl 1-phosphate transferase [bacterium]